jgi:GxxExxY protein
MMGTKERANWLSNQNIGAASEVHKNLGLGLLESAYQVCHRHELGLRGISVQTEVSLLLNYKGVKLDCGYRMDEVVDGLDIVEIKAVESLEPIHKAQLLTYLRLSGLWLGLLIDFNAPILKQGIKRLVLG